MKALILGVLVGLNLVLLVAFMGKVWPETPAHAQNMRIGDYILIPGSVEGQPNDVVYIVDIANRQLSAMQYDDAGKKIVSMAPIDLTRVFEQGAGDGQGRRR